MATQTPDSHGKKPGKQGTVQKLTPLVSDRQVGRLLIPLARQSDATEQSSPTAPVPATSQRFWTQLPLEQVPQLSVPPQPSETLPHVAPTEAHVSG